MRTDVPLRLARDVTYQSLGEDEDTVVLALESGQLYTCNDTAQAFLDAVDGERTFEDIILELLDQFEVAPDRLRSDMVSLAEDLMREKLIVEGGE
jgi:pyrroloquinoline quinone biosynthesis protein D